MIKCPICNQKLQPNDRLYVEWYEPCRWFVLHHERDNENYCQQANHSSVQVLTQAFRNDNED